MASRTPAPALRLPPHSLEAEQALLGGLMLEEAHFFEIADQLQEDDFYRREHRLIFRAMQELSERHQTIDVITVSERLKTAEQLEQIGGLVYLATLAREAPGVTNLRGYAEIIHNRGLLRQMMELGSRFSEEALDWGDGDAAELLDRMEQALFALGDHSQKRRSAFASIGELLGVAIKRIDTLYQAGDAVTGLATGFTELDALTSGLHAGELIILAGRPSMGKTSFGMNIVEHIALRHKAPCAIFSMEMPGEQLALRLIASLGRIEQNRIRTGQLQDEDWDRITSAVGLLSDVPIFIDDTAALSPMELRARARRLKRERGLGLVLVDYLQLMRIPGTRENRTNEISEISRSLKALAKELSVPVVALSQLNRNLESRPDKRPVMSDLRESGGIEQDADVIAFIYRDEVYNPESPEKGIAEIRLAKQRNGPTGMFKTTFLGTYTRFENFAPESMMMTETAFS